MRISREIKRRIEHATFDKSGVQRHISLWHRAAKEAISVLEKSQAGTKEKRKR